ncbi:hypothetical protein RJ641_015477 [Dillenia turbinata]|uniref:CCHC-type domain-containing protein n=1 Tax=Dillenia turbinata TaxID=194707 RepID=A0AAN8V1B2_9MAGN
MKNEDSFDTYSAKLSEIVNQMRKYGENVFEQKVVEKILRSLPKKYEHIVAAIKEANNWRMYFTQSYSCPKGIPKTMSQAAEATTLSQAAKGIMVVNLIVKIEVAEAEDILVVEIKIRKIGRRLVNLSKFQCYYCNKFGHIKKYCRLKEKHAKFAEQEATNESESLFMTVVLDVNPNLEHCEFMILIYRRCWFSAIATPSKALMGFYSAPNSDL